MIKEYTDFLDMAPRPKFKSTASGTRRMFKSGATQSQKSSTERSVRFADGSKPKRPFRLRKTQARQSKAVSHKSIKSLSQEAAFLSLKSTRSLTPSRMTMKSMKSSDQSMPSALRTQKTLI